MSIVFGKRRCQIKFLEWNSADQRADIVYIDEEGKEHVTNALSMDAQTARRAVLDDIIKEYKS